MRRHLLLHADAVPVRARSGRWQLADGTPDDGGRRGGRRRGRRPARSRLTPVADLVEGRLADGGERAAIGELAGIPLHANLQVGILKVTNAKNKLYHEEDSLTFDRRILPLVSESNVWVLSDKGRKR
jgi:hypothetical protein